MNPQNSNEKQMVRIMDTTLRDGEQSPGVVFSTGEKLSIAAMLADTGVRELEVGIPAMGKKACRDIKSIVRLNLPCPLTAWSRATVRDIESSAACGTQAVHISFPVSPILLKAFGKDESWILKSMGTLIPLAKRHFDLVFVGAQDATRTGQAFLESVALHAEHFGAHRLRIADTVGISRPMAIAGLIKNLKEKVPDLPLEFHGHNDLGMATANAVTAAEAGVDCLSVTVNGLGERAGNAPLEEVAMVLSGMKRLPAGFKLPSLTALSRLVAAASACTVHPSKPIVGKSVFRHESGIHCSGLLKDQYAYQPFDPSEVGQEASRFTLGSHSGSGIIRHLLEESGIVINENEAKKLLDLVRNTACQTKRALSPDELVGLYDAMAS